MVWLATLGQPLPVSAADAEVEPRDVTPAEMQAVTETWVDALWSFYSTGETDLSALATPNGLEELRAYDWRYRAVESGSMRFVEVHELVDTSGREPWEFGPDGEHIAFGVDFVVDVAPYAEADVAGEDMTIEIVTGRQRRIANAMFRREPGTETWLVDGVGPPADPDYTVGLEAPGAPRPCPRRSRVRSGSDPFLATPWCTAGGDGRSLVSGDSNRSGPPEIIVEREPCGPGSTSAHVMYVGSPPGAPIGSFESGDYVRDPQGVMPGPKAYRRDVRLPRDAISTGITNGTATIWTIASVGQAAIFVQVGNRFERWPRSRVGCGGPA